MTQPTAPARRRRRTVAAADAPAVTLSTTLEALYALKVANDEAKARYDEGKKQYAAQLAAEGKTEHMIAAHGDRPAVAAKMVTRATTTVDPAKYRTLVDADEFAASVTVKLGEAKKYLGENDLAKVTTTTQSTPSLDVRVKGASRK